MPINILNLIGAGGHAAVVGDAALLQGITSLAFYTQNAATLGERTLNFDIALLDSDAQLEDFHVAIGSNIARERLYNQFSTPGNRPVTVAHPQATISLFAEVGLGSFVAAAAIVAPRSQIGLGVIVNHGAIVDHDVFVGNFSHIAPGVILGGGVHVGEHVLVGAGAKVLPGVSIGNAAIIGAGAVVLHDIAAGQTVAGVPARQI